MIIEIYNYTTTMYLPHFANVFSIGVHLYVTDPFTLMD